MDNVCIGARASRQGFPLPERHFTHNAVTANVLSITATSESKREPIEYDRIPKLQYLRIGDPRVGHMCVNAASAIPCRSLRKSQNCVY